MPLPRARFTVSRTMIAVAFLAVVITGFRGWRWRTYCLRTAAAHRANAQRCSDSVDFHAMLTKDAEEKVRWGDLSWKDSAAQQRREAELARRWSSYWNELGRKYEAAAAHPWLPVEHDPPLRLPALLVPESTKGQTTATK
jgi:hypothetical protein